MAIIQDPPALNLSLVPALEFPILLKRGGGYTAPQSLAREALNFNPQEAVGTIPQYQEYKKKKEEYVRQLRTRLPYYYNMGTFLSSDEGKQWQNKYEQNESLYPIMSLSAGSLESSMQTAGQYGILSNYVLGDDFKRKLDDQGKPLTYSDYYLNAFQKSGINEKGEFVVPETPRMYDKEYLESWMKYLADKIPSESKIFNYYEDKEGKRINVKNMPDDFYGMIQSFTVNKEGNVEGRKALLSYLFGVDQNSLEVTKENDIRFPAGKQLDLSKAKIPRDALVGLKQRFYEAIDRGVKDRGGNVLEEEDFSQFVEDEIAGFYNYQDRKNESVITSMEMIQNSTGMIGDLMKSFGDMQNDAASMSPINKYQHPGMVQPLIDLDPRKEQLNLQYIYGDWQIPMTGRYSNRVGQVASIPLDDPINKGTLVDPAITFEGEGKVKGIDETARAKRRFPQMLLVGTGQVVNTDEYLGDSFIESIGGVTFIPRINANGLKEKDASGNEIQDPAFVVNLITTRDRIDELPVPDSDIANTKAENRINPLALKSTIAKWGPIILDNLMDENYYNLFLSELPKDRRLQELRLSTGLDGKELYHLIAKTYFDNQGKPLSEYPDFDPKFRVVNSYKSAKKMNPEELEKIGFRFEKSKKRGPGDKVEMDQIEETIDAETNTRPRKAGVVRYKALVRTSDFSPDVQDATKNEGLYQQLLQMRGQAEIYEMRQKLGR